MLLAIEPHNLQGSWTQFKVLVGLCVALNGFTVLCLFETQFLCLYHTAAVVFLARSLLLQERAASSGFTARLSALPFTLYWDERVREHVKVQFLTRI